MRGPRARSRQISFHRGPINGRGDRSVPGGNVRPAPFVDHGEGRSGTGSMTLCGIRQRTRPAFASRADGGVMRDFTWAERSPRLVGGGGGDLLGRAGEARIGVLAGCQAAKQNLTSARSRRRLTACQVPDTPEGPDRGDHRHPQSPPSRTPAPPRTPPPTDPGGDLLGRRPPEAQYTPPQPTRMQPARTPAHVAVRVEDDVGGRNTSRTSGT